MILEGRVQLNGAIAQLGQKADPACDRLEVDGVAIQTCDRPNYIYLLINKPAGVVSTCSDPQNRTTVLTLLPLQLQQGQGLHPVGRLDFESTGALLLTNDGDLTFHLTHPRHHIPKTYEVWVQGNPSRHTLQQWQDGVMLDDQRTRSATVRVLERQSDRTLLQVVLREGRNRQIRRVAEQLGHPVIHLHRTAIGSIQLRSPTAIDLALGAHRPLEAAEVSSLKAQIDLISERVPVEQEECPPMKKQNLPSDHAQTAKLADLGCRLQQLRQQKGLTLEQVSVRTLVPMRILTAIESGNLKQLPEPVYVQGFIRRYADAVGMNGAALAEEFPLGAFAHADRPVWQHFNIQAQLRPLHLYLLYMVLVMGSVGGLSYLLNRPSQVVGLLEVPKSSPLASPAAVQIGPVPAAKPKLTDSSSSIAPLPAGKSVQVGVKLTEQSWISIVADGKNEFEGVLPEGSQRTWVADKQLTVRAGNAGGVMVSFNNGKSKPLGNPGSVEEVTFGTNPQMGQLPDQPGSTLTAANLPSF